MSINFDVVIDTEEHEVDMKSGLDTLQGISEATRLISETVLTEHVPQRLSHKSNVRTTLKQSFKGSYGHVFSLDLYDEALEKRFKRIGRQTFTELTSYFISEALYQESNELSKKAAKIIDQLGDKSGNLISQLRISSLRNVHEISTKFGHDVKFRYRQNRNTQTEIAKFNKTTVLSLQAHQVKKLIQVEACVTRLNINTGNGRLLLKGSLETVPFGFGIEYREVVITAKKLFSENLNHNNGIPKDEWKYLRIGVQPVKLQDGKLVKYIVRNFYQ